MFLERGMVFTHEAVREWEAQLAPFFPSITVADGRDTLRITDVEAVVGYVLSFDGAKQVIVGDRLDALHRRVREEIESAGAFIVRTHSGLFVARKA